MSLPKGHSLRLVPDDSGCLSLDLWPSGDDMQVGVRVQPTDDTLTGLLIETVSGLASPRLWRLAKLTVTDKLNINDLFLLLSSMDRPLLSMHALHACI